MRALLLFCLATSVTAADREGIVRERHQLFTLATLALTHSKLLAKSTEGHAISAAVAWDVEDITATPPFQMGVNENLKNQSEVHHAEVVVLHRAWESLRKPYPKGLDNEGKRAHYRHRMMNATVYTTLEPCPMCAATAFMSRVPRVIFAMEDTAFRDRKTHALFTPTVGTFYGRSLELVVSDHPVATELNRAVWEAEEKALAGQGKSSWVMRNADGTPRLNLIAYLHEEGPALFQPAVVAFKSPVKHPENRALQAALMKDLFPSRRVKAH